MLFLYCVSCPDDVVKLLDAVEIQTDGFTVFLSTIKGSSETFTGINARGIHHAYLVNETEVEK